METGRSIEWSSAESRNDHGIATIWVAVIFMFLAASAAIAIDASGAFGLAQTDQNISDLACLGGAPELPDDTAAINNAYVYAVANWPEMDGLTPTVVGSTATYDKGDGNILYIDAAYGGDTSTMLVRTTRVGETYFGKMIGQDEMTVVQEAACSGQSVTTGTGMLPVGALTGSWSGDLFDCAAKVTGNCGALSPGGGGANAYRDAVANGIIGSFVRHHGNHNIPFEGQSTIDCMAIPCNVTRTEPGNMVGPWNQGLAIRFNTPSEPCTEDGWFYNCTIEDAVYGGESVVPLSGAAASRGVSEAELKSELGWDDSIHGTFDAAKAATLPNARHFYYNGNTLDCDSPRFATVPIIDNDLDWAPGFPSSGWPNGKKDMKMIGFYTIYIREPDTVADLGGPMDADIIWFGPNAMCEDQTAFQPFGSSLELDLGVKLVAP